MLTPGHIAAGYLISFLFLKATHAESVLGSDATNTLLLVGTLMGTAPDIDFLPFFLKHRSLKLQQKDSHRDYVTHTPFLWLCVAILVYIFFGMTAFSAYLGFIVWLGTWSHFLADSIEYGISWLRPFSQKRFAVWSNYPEERAALREQTILRHYWEFSKLYMTRSRTVFFEIAAILAALAVLIG
jgi:membrane-bound metal-dependent hydrolase YbcI (DUF457 family)